MKRTKHTLITAEILGFFLIIVALLALMTGRQSFMIGAYVLFTLIVAVAALFAVFATLAVKEKRRPRTKKK